MDERIYQIALSILSGLGPVRARILLDTVGEPAAVFTDKTGHLEKIQGIPSDILKREERARSLSRAEKELDFIEKNNIQLHYFDDANYPELLRQCYDAPIVLFTMGAVDFRRQNIGVVGTRKSTSYGKKMTDTLIDEVKPAGVQIVSGLAHGIDKLAHEAALRNGLPTLGVLGHGLDTMYPAAHRSLAAKMLENGGLVTEFVSGVVGDPGNFPRRNRIVAGLCEALVVVESSETGGSMITANLANDYNREVFAFPGNADKTSSSGCNNLIRRNRARLITSGQELLEIMNWDGENSFRVVQSELFEQLDPLEEKIVQFIRNLGSPDIDTLGVSCEIPVSELSLHLFNLEMKGLIHAVPGRRYALS